MLSGNGMAAGGFVVCKKRSRPRLRGDGAGGARPCRPHDVARETNAQHRAMFRWRGSRDRRVKPFPASVFQHDIHVRLDARIPVFPSIWSSSRWSAARLLISSWSPRSARRFRAFPRSFISERSRMSSRTWNVKRLHKIMDWPELSSLRRLCLSIRAALAG